MVDYNTTFRFLLYFFCNFPATFLITQSEAKHLIQKTDSLTLGLEDTFAADAGCLMKQDDLKKIYESARKSCAAARKNMSRPMIRRLFHFLLKHNRIENVWSVMKLNYNLIYHRERSVGGGGMFRHFFYSISAFLFHSVEDAKQMFLPNLVAVVKLEF